VLHGGLLTIDLKDFVNCRRVQARHVVAGALERCALVALSWRLDLLWTALLLRLGNQVRRWPVISSIHIHIEGEIACSLLRGHGLVVLSPGALRSRRSLVQNGDEHR